MFLIYKSRKYTHEKFWHSTPTHGNTSLEQKINYPQTNLSHYVQKVHEIHTPTAQSVQFKYCNV